MEKSKRMFERPIHLYSVYVLSELPDCEDDIYYGGFDYYPERIGFYFDKKQALDAVRENRLDMHEDCYTYAIVKEEEEGLFTDYCKVYTFEFDKETRTYKETTISDYVLNMIM